VATGLHLIEETVMAGATSRSPSPLFLFPALLAIGLVAVPEARAQNIAATPTYGDVRLEGGFLPDPHTTALTAGGSVDVSRGACQYGKVANAPDVDLYYSGNGGRTLYIYVRSSIDTTLLVNLPQGDWVCDDDSLGNLDPLLIVRNAPSGLYNVWVGTYGDSMGPGLLYISEIDPR
jgi:hypothetical protein